MKDAGLWAALGVVALAVLGGSAAVVVLDRKTVAKMLRDAFERHGMPGVWGEALGRQESGLSWSATNKAGADGARGGAWGPTQITATTARAWGYTGPMEDLARSPELAAELTAQMAAGGFAERGGRTYSYGTPDTFEQLCAIWNAGRTLDDPNLPSSTRDRYIPSALAHLAAAVAASSEVA